MTLPEGLKSIESYAFTSFTSLADITIPDDVNSIGYHTFNNCESLTSLTVPKSVVSFSDEAFSNCANLTFKCYADSDAEKYAKENGLKYETFS